MALSPYISLWIGAGGSITHPIKNAAMAARRSFAPLRRELFLVSAMA
jgi:hypothetical protein